MILDKPLQSLYLSLMAFAKGFNPALDFVNFDASSDEDQIPNKDVIGPMALTFEEDEHILTGSMQVGISTWQDKNNLRLMSLIDPLFVRLQATKTIDLYQAGLPTRQKVGDIVILNGTRLMPALEGRTRILQFVAIRFNATNTI